MEYNQIVVEDGAAFIVLNPRRVTNIKFASIKPRFDITRNVYVKVVSPDFVGERRFCSNLYFFLSDTNLMSTLFSIFSIV